MDFEKFSDRLKGFVQSAQTLAIREGNPQITPEHLLKVLLDDPEGLAAGLITKAGGKPKEALERTEAALAKLPKVSGGGAQVHMAAGACAACSTRPSRSRPRPATASSPSSACCRRLPWRRRPSPRASSPMPA